jgi:hypothetical protein
MFDLSKLPVNGPGNFVFSVSNYMNTCIDTIGVTAILEVTAFSIAI